MSIKRRLGKIEKAASEAGKPKGPWSSPEVYARLREKVQAEIERDLQRGRKSRCWIDDDGFIRATDDDSFVRHRGEYMQTLDREIARLERETDEARANMNPE